MTEHNYGEMAVSALKQYKLDSFCVVSQSFCRKLKIICDFKKPAKPAVKMYAPTSRLRLYLKRYIFHCIFVFFWDGALKSESGTFQVNACWYQSCSPLAVTKYIGRPFHPHNLLYLYVLAVNFFCMLWNATFHKHEKIYLANPPCHQHGTGSHQQCQSDQIEPREVFWIQFPWSNYHWWVVGEVVMTTMTIIILDVTFPFSQASVYHADNVPSPPSSG